MAMPGGNYVVVSFSSSWCHGSVCDCDIPWSFVLSHISSVVQYFFLTMSYTSVFSLEKGYINFVPKSVRLSVRSYVRFLVIASPPKPLAVATPNLVAA